MWFFGKKYSLDDIGYFSGFTDCHSHLLPGVDDGIQTVDEALQILHFYEKKGVKKVWLTPHIMEDLPNSTEHLRSCFDKLQEAYTGPVILRLSAENMLDNLFEERLSSGDLLPFGEKKNALLVETSYMHPPVGFRETLLRIKSKGYYPILAHPERYAYMDFSDYQALKQLGVLFQLNLFSLNAVYGKAAKEKALLLLKNHLYDLAGSDVHGSAFLQRNITRKSFHKSVLKELDRLEWDDFV